MALTRKMLEALGVEEKAVEQIIDAHIEVVNGLKDKLKAAEENAGKSAEAMKELEDLKKGDYKARYEKEHKEYEEYKKSVTAKETKAAKETAVKAYFEGKNITGKNLEIALRGSRDEIEALDLDESGNIKDTKALDALVAGTFAGLVVSQQKQGAPKTTPPGGGNPTVLTKQEIMKIKDTTERQKAWAEYLTKGNK